MVFWTQSKWNCAGFQVILKLSAMEQPKQVLPDITRASYCPTRTGQTISEKWEITQQTRSETETIKNTPGQCGEEIMCIILEVIRRGLHIIIQFIFTGIYHDFLPTWYNIYIVYIKIQMHKPIGVAWNVGPYKLNRLPGHPNLNLTN